LPGWLYSAHYCRFNSLGFAQDVADKIQRYLTHLGNLHHGFPEQAVQIPSSLTVGQEGSEGTLELTNRGILLVKFEAIFTVGSNMNKVAQSVLKRGSLPDKESLGTVKLLLINLKTING